MAYSLDERLLLVDPRSQRVHFKAYPAIFALKQECHRFTQPVRPEKPACVGFCAKLALAKPPNLVSDVIGQSVVALLGLSVLLDRSQSVTTIQQ